MVDLSSFFLLYEGQLLRKNTIDIFIGLSSDHDEESLQFWVAKASNSSVEAIFLAEHLPGRGKKALQPESVPSVPSEDW